MRFIFGLLTLFLFSSKIYADHGLLFKSNEVSKEQRTGVDVTHKNYIAYASSFAIQFDISFRETETHYGEILSLKEANGNNLLQITFRDPDLFVIQNKRETKFHCNFEELKLLNNRWLPLELKIDAEKGLVYFSLGNVNLQAPVEFPKNSEFALSLGVVNKYGFYIDEVPSISIKDLTIHIDGQPKHLWPFRKTDKSLLKDILSSRTAKLYNPDWVVDYHNKWNKLKTLQFPSTPSMAFDPEKELIYFVLENGLLYSFSLQNNILSSSTKKKGYPVFEKSQQLILNKDNELVSYSLNQNKLSIYNFKDQSWSQTDSLNTNLPKLWHHNKLIHPISNQITTMCGYGYYSYYNSIRSFDEKHKTWVELRFGGDTIQPRYLSAFGCSPNNKTIGYLFGGLGNDLGKQILGKEFYFDLYKINFKTRKIKRLWELKHDDQFQFLPVNSLNLTQNDSAFYTLMFPSSKYKTHLRIVKALIHSPKLEFIGDSIPYQFIDIQSFADLYYWKSENKLVALTSHKTPEATYEVNLYSINYKPGGEEDDTRFHSSSLPLSIKLFYVFFTLCFIVLLFFIRKKLQQQQRLFQKQKDEITIPDESLYQIPKINSILLLGNFQVYDNNSKEISYRFSPTLKELFLLILLHSLGEGKGISSKRIQDYLWPDKPESKAKNNRGVNIKKLRSILEDIRGAEIVFESSYWKITFSDSVFCDLEYIQQKIKELQNSKNLLELDDVIQVLKRGTLLRDIHAEWLDSFKDRNTGLIVNFLEEAAVSSTVDSSKQLLLSNTIFEFDPMNETALRIKCRLLSDEGKHSLAVETYENYKKLYLRLYNEKYKHSFKDIVSES